MSILGKTVKHIGILTPEEMNDCFPIGLSKVSTDKPLSIAFIDQNGETQNMFVLEPGTHKLLRPQNVHILISCDDYTKWNVTFPGRFGQSDPTRVSASLVRPRSQKEEMHDYMNEMYARMVQAEQAQKIRSGELEVDTSTDDLDLDDDDDLEDAPLSMYQIQHLMDQMQADLIRRQKHQDKKDDQKTTTPPPAEQKESADKAAPSASPPTKEAAQ